MPPLELDAAVTATVAAAELETELELMAVELATDPALAEDAALFAPLDALTEPLPDAVDAAPSPPSPPSPVSPSSKTSIAEPVAHALHATARSAAPARAAAARAVGRRRFFDGADIGVPPTASGPAA